MVKKYIMELQMKHAEIILRISNKAVKKASEINNGEILDAVEKSSSFEDFEEIFQKLIESK